MGSRRRERGRERVATTRRRPQRKQKKILLFLCDLMMGIMK
jgi:hypothetical protein